MAEQWIKNILNGDKEAFRHIIRKYQDSAYSLALSVVKDEREAAEVTQNAFVKAYSGLNGFKGKSAFSTWLYRVVINEAFKFLKKNKPHLQHLTTEELEENELVADENEMMLNADKDHKRYYINRALQNLPSGESLALRMFYLEECSVRDICDATGWSESNVKVMLHRGREKMKKLLAGIYDLNTQHL